MARPPENNDMTIVVCPLSKVTEMIDAYAPERIVSLLDPEFTFPEAGPDYANRHLRLSFHDIHIPTEAQVIPSAKHIDDLLAFVAAWKRIAPILIHCRAGIGRSTAAAFITACLHNPYADEQDIAITLRRVSPLARPNETLIGLADHAMRRNGRMIKAIVDTGRDLPWIFDDVDEGEPFEMPSEYRQSDTKA
jgi:predicted protein tyrosine phosphatase